MVCCQQPSPAPPCALAYADPSVGAGQGGQEGGLRPLQVEAAQNEAGGFGPCFHLPIGSIVEFRFF